MRLRGIGLALATACMGLGNAFAQVTDGLNALSSTLRFYQPSSWTQSSRYKSKLNRISQAKRRKYARQGRG